MFFGKVVGTLWSSVKWEKLEGLKFLLVKPYHLDELVPSGLNTCQDMVVAVDIIDAGVGDEVVVAYGHAARVALESTPQGIAQPSFPIDAAVVAVVDSFILDETAKGDFPQ